MCWTPGIDGPESWSLSVPASIAGLAILRNHYQYHMIVIYKPIPSTAAAGSVQLRSMSFVPGACHKSSVAFIKWTVSWMNRSNTSKVLWACKRLLEAVHEKKNDTKLPRLLQSKLKYGSYKQKGAEAQPIDVMRPSLFFQRTLAKCFLSPVQDLRGNRKGLRIREGRNYLLNVYPLILFILDLIFTTQKSGCNLHFSHEDTKSQRSCPMQPLSFILSVVDQGVKLSSIWSECPWTFHSKYGISSR